MIIALLILLSAVPVLRASSRVLLQAAPAMVSVSQVRRLLLQARVLCSHIPTHYSRSMYTHRGRSIHTSTHMYVL
jgi:Co/Zn/Cd efflux system component